MKVQHLIENKLKTIEPVHMEVINESHMHSVPKNSETHFKVIVVSSRFEGQTRINRHRILNELLKEEMAGPVHALSLKLYTPQEWNKLDNMVLISPDCRGGSRVDS